MDGTEEETIKETVIKKDDGMLALTILVIAIVAVILFGIRYYRNSAKKAAIDPRYVIQDQVDIYVISNPWLLIIS